ncbi:MAG TPA: aspartyl protease family protein [Usitatibacter sp.]|nr:aspartyl protease family protein [Usitatibacter sp.]
MRSIVLALALVLAGSAFAAEPAKCKFVRIAEWPVRLRGGLPIVEGEIDGKKVGVLVDTGAYLSLITNSAAQRLGLETRSTFEWVSGFGGASRVLATRIEEIRIGNMVSKHLRVRVSGERPFPGVDLILGEDFFQQVDLEFDYAHGVVRLFQPLDCGKDVPLSYWDPNAIRLPIEDERQVYVPVKVNGHEGRAMIDSGAAAGSVMSLQLADDAGITPQTPGVQPAACTFGIGAGNVRLWVARFDSIGLGDETIHDAHLQLADYVGGWRRVPEMILGSDFLRAHRVLIARSQRKVYFSYTGGRIFPATPSIDCDDLPRVKNTPEAIAALDQAIASNPKDAKALLRRGMLRARSDPTGARSDLDAVIALDPDNAVALSTRSALRGTQKDYAGALADSEAAIALGMRTPAIYVARAYLRRAQDDFAGALAELDEAVRLDPHDPYAVQVQGRFLFVAGRFEAAEGDFVTLLAMRPHGFDTLWLALARERRGLDNRAALEDGLKPLGDEWPAPVLKYFLGGLGQEGLLAAAAAGEEDKRKGRECEARFYTAEHLVTQHRVDDARKLFEAARDGCPRNFIEYDAALMELHKPAASDKP